jgi:hypothetical protein
MTKELVAALGITPFDGKLETTVDDLRNQAERCDACNLN